MSLDLDRFTLSQAHINLARNMFVGWQDCETGAPEIDPKRPYGNSAVAYDVCEILGWEWDSRDGELSLDEADEELYDFAMETHREMETAVEIILRHAGTAVEPGVYISDKYQSNWRRAEE